MKKPFGRIRRAGDVATGSGVGATINLDAGSRDQIRWQQHVCKRLLGTDAGNSVIVRRALALYTQHLEKLAKKHSGDEQRLQREAWSLQRAASGEREALPERELIAVPIKPYSEIRKAAGRKRVEQMRRAIFAPLYPGEYRGDR